ncbi:hypothetical protein SDC9_199136 [bioreactor metagenome]|uniref:Uncharacterized protein n=1 Tax=bioreactor metagenome TaxID=1076179 RepID=A0A645IJM7_9ZZZZ
MIGHAVGKHSLESLMISFSRFLDPGRYQCFFVICKHRDGQIVPFQRLQLFERGGQIGHRGADLQHNHLRGIPLIDQLQVFIIALRVVGEVHVQNAVVDIEGFPAPGVILQDHGHDSTRAALDRGQAFGLEYNIDFRQTHSFTPFHWF